MPAKNSKSSRLTGRFKFVFFLILASCGYRWQPEGFAYQRPSISVPFVQGDEDGSFTNEVVRALSYSGWVDVKLRESDYRLEIKIINSASEVIGFRKDRQKVDGKISRNMVADEGRKTVSVEATLFKGSTKEIAYGPYCIAADAAYDYVDGDSYTDLTFVDSKGISRAVLPYSLGQLESAESAQEAAVRPLYFHLAQKIVDVISAEW